MSRDTIRDYWVAIANPSLLTQAEEQRLGQQVQATLPLLEIPGPDRTSEQ